MNIGKNLDVPHLTPLVSGCDVILQREKVVWKKKEGIYTFSFISLQLNF